MTLKQILEQALAKYAASQGTLRKVAYNPYAELANSRREEFLKNNPPKPAATPAVKTTFYTGSSSGQQRPTAPPPTGPAKIVGYGSGSASNPQQPIPAAKPAPPAKPGGAWANVPANAGPPRPGPNTVYPAGGARPAPAPAPAPPPPARPVDTSRSQAARAVAANTPTPPRLAQGVADVQDLVQQGQPMPMDMRPGPLDNLPTEYTQQPAPAPPPMAPGNAQYADANPDGSVNWDSVRPDASVPYTPPATSVADSSTASEGEHWAPLTPEQNQQLQTPAAPAPAPTTAAPTPTSSAPPDDMTPTPGGPQPLERVPAEAGEPNAKADPAPIPAPTPKPQHNPTQRYKTEQEAIKALENPNLDDEGRRLAAGKLVDSKMANIPAEDRAMLRSIANGETGDHVRAYLSQGLDKFKQEQAAQAVQENPGMATNPQEFGSFMGQVENMWNSMGPYGQIASMIGIPAAVFGLMGGDGISSILGGLGIGALGLGAGAMGFLGEGTQRSMGQLMNQAGNFFGVVPDELTNADAFSPDSPESKAFEAQVENAYKTQGPAAAQQLIDQRMAKFDELQQFRKNQPELAAALTMGMRGDTAPTTRAGVDTFWDQVGSRAAEARDPNFLRNKVKGKIVEQLQAGNTTDNPLTNNSFDAMFKNRAGERGSILPNSAIESGIVSEMLKQDPSLSRYLIQNEDGTYALPAGNSYDELAENMLQQETGWAKSGSAVARRVYAKQRIKRALMRAMDQKELNDLKQQDPQTLDEKKVRRLKELQARQAADLPAAKVVTVCMKAARCWAGYEAVPGAKAYSRGSCRPVGSKKTQKEMKNGTERQHEKVKQSGASSRPQVAKSATQRPGARTKTSGRPARH